MLDTFIMIEGYCHVLMERVVLIENQKDCPDELKEAIASLIFAGSRCGELPELQEIRYIFITRFGKEFVEAAVELRNSCGVNPKMIQKMSTRQPSLEVRLKMMKGIAYENGIAPDLEESSFGITEEESNLSQSQPRCNRSDVSENAENSVKGRAEDDPHGLRELDQDEQFSGSMKERKYADVASAAQAAFESAAYAAAAARAAVELSRSESQEKGLDDQSSSGPRRRKKYNGDQDGGSSRSRSGFGETPTGISVKEKDELFSDGSGSEKIHALQSSSSESENQEPSVKHGDVLLEEFKGNSNAELERSTSVLSLDSSQVTLKEMKMMSNEMSWTKPLEKAMSFYESDEENQTDWGRISFKNNGLDFDGETTLLKEANKSSPTSSNGQIIEDLAINQFRKYRQFDAVSDEYEGTNLYYPYQNRNSITSHADGINSLQRLDKVGLGFENGDNPAAYYMEGRSQPETE
ncbi:uncharacterized protein LOC131227889 [Magnolia sinica]|uniref:uncharacterized protein LOC131227889 n=1 Tax=Magnolia sinica TaxID=86752 RepID=UPI002658DC56|nr:uncharacterized protein LOC131227889 [Magnolia sinica]